jgi:hypothetical protein
MEPSPSCSVVDLADLQRETGRRGGGLVGGKGETGAKRRDTAMERRWTCGSNAGGRAARFAWAASSSLGQRRVGEEIGWSSFVAKQISRNVEVWGSTFGWGVVTHESGQPNIQPKCLARISSTSKELKLRHSGRECPNIQGQASIQTSKRTLRAQTLFQKHTASRHSRRREIGRVQKHFPAPCRRGESPPEAFFITMPTSGVMCK